MDLNDNKNNSPQRPGDFKPRGNRTALLLFLVLASLFGIYLFSSDTGAEKRISYSEFKAFVESTQVEAVEIIDGQEIRVIMRGSEGPVVKRTQIPYVDMDLMPWLEEKGVDVSGAYSGVSLWQILFQILPWAFGFIIIWMIFKQNQGNSRAFSFGKSLAKRYSENGKKVTFADVAGQKEAKYELQEVVEYLKNQNKYVKMGARIPKGVLLVGMPGTGKTLLAKAVAGEANVPFFHMSGSDFVEMFVGVGASRVRDLFEQARRNAPCIVFIDELDAVGRTRGAGYGGGHDEREQTLNQMLVEMDGFDTKDGVIILSATNRPDVLDPALLRPGRFDRQVVVAMPDIQEREQILAIHMKKIKVDPTIDPQIIARATPGTSGADLANLVNEAALLAIRLGKDAAGMADFEEARDKILMGVARKSMFITEKEKLSTAYHEAGHALLHYYLPNADPLHKVTIIPHGRALGIAFSLPEKDEYARRMGWLRDRIVICFGGYAAEKIIYGETTTGVSNDIKQATQLARSMVCEWGMAEGLSPLSYGQEDEPIFIGKEIARHKDYSDETARKLDDAIATIVNEGLKTAMDILSEHRDQLETLAQELIVKETLIDADICSMFGFEPRKSQEKRGE